LINHCTNKQEVIFMKVNGSPAVYRFVIRPNTDNDPRSIGYLSDAHSLGIQQVQEISCHDLYFLRGQLSAEQVQQLANQLLHDPVTQSVETTLLNTPETASKITETPLTSTRIIEVALRPGVTDPVAEQILRAAHIMGITTIDAASTGLRFIIKGQDLSESLLQQLAKRLLSNAVIQYYTLGKISPSFSEAVNDNDQVERFNFRVMDDEELMRFSTERRAALNLTEMKAIRNYCLKENRDLTDIEFEMLAQTWSEHCVHKTFKSRVTIDQKESAARSFPKEYEHLFNQTIRAATRQVSAPWVLSAFTENAGIVEFDGPYEISFKVETHNHPSAIEPFGGANTGIGGVIRDIIGVSAKPIASTDILCFGPPDMRLEELPDGVLHPRRIASGVVAGIQDYGNKMGIPTVNGAVWYDPGYTANPLVFCGSIGIAPKGSNPHNITPGDHIIVLGGRTGRDGLRGATFSSMTMDAQTGEVSGASVQIGAPVVEKGLVDVLMLARDQQLYHAITDCGAGGLSSAVGEMASESGGEVQLANVPLKYPGLVPWEIWLSEAQERMVIAVPSENLAALRSLCHEYEVELTDIGTFTQNNRMRVFYGKKLVLDLDNQFLHHGLPQRHYSALISPPRCTPGLRNPDSLKVHVDFELTLLCLLSHANIASKERIIRDYDHEVQGGTVVKPLCGIQHDGPSDGSVIKPLISQTRDAFVLSNGLNPEYGKLDPYQMTLLVVDEAIRNAVACGADPDRIALLDNFCWGDPNRPEIMGDLVQAAQACFDAAVLNHSPFISGKDSFNNEYLGSDGKVHAIPPTLLISALGWMPDWEQSLTMDLKKAGNLLYLVGDFNPAFGGSHFNLVNSKSVIEESIPLCSELNPDLYRTFYRAIEQRLIAACHDLSEGGLAVTVSEMMIAGRMGVKLDLGNDPDPLRTLFGETSGCLLVEVPQENKAAFEIIMGTLPCRLLGTVENNPILHVTHNTRTLMDIALPKLLSAWKDRKIEGVQA
jgi:phosphoribosylformylglycinamidine synthase II